MVNNQPTNRRPKPKKPDALEASKAPVNNMSFLNELIEIKDQVPCQKLVNLGICEAPGGGDSAYEMGGDARWKF